MGTKSVITTDRLYWLGRYSERVYTTLKMYEKSFDQLIEQSAVEYSEICTLLEIPNIYTDKDDFIARYAFSLEDPNSIISNLTRAYDNAIELREEIGSETLAYIQLAIYSMQKAALNESPFIELQKVQDDILAFWGIVDDQIDDEDTRNIIKIGKRMERLDLYARIHAERKAIERECSRLMSRLLDGPLEYDSEKCEELKKLIAEDRLNYRAIVSAVENLTEA